MSTDPERDRSTDALLRAALPSLPARDGVACLSAETLAAWSDGSLPSSEAARADAHLSECSRCQQMLAAFARTEPVATAAVPFWQRWPRRWLVPVSAAAVAALIFAVVTREDPLPAVQMAKVDAPAEPARRPSTQAPLSEPASSAAPEPPALSDRMASARTPSVAAERADAAATGESRRRAEEAPAGRSVQDGIAVLPGVAGGLAAPPPANVNVNAAARPVEAPTTVRQEPPPGAAPKELAKADDQGRARPESAQVENAPLDTYRNYQAGAVTIIPSTEADAAAGKQPQTATLSGVGEAVAVTAEIVSAPRPALGRTVAGRGGGIRGPESARAAGEDAAAASKLPATIAARWRVFANGRVDRSTNGGATWRPVSIQTPVPLTGGSSPSDLVCWLIGPNGVVLLSTDGTRFTRVPFPEPANLVSITAVNDRAATVRASDGRTFVTGDGGGSWTRQ